MKSSNTLKRSKFCRWGIFQMIGCPCGPKMEIEIPCSLYFRRRCKHGWVKLFEVINKELTIAKNLVRLNISVRIWISVRHWTHSFAIDTVKMSNIRKMLFTESEPIWSRKRTGSAAQVVSRPCVIYLSSYNPGNLLWSASASINLSRYMAKHHSLASLDLQVNGYSIYVSS